MAAPVAVQGAEYAFALDYFLQSCHHGQRRFLFHQLRVIDLAAGIVQNDNQVIPALILEPAMPAAIDVQQHTWQRAPRSAFAMHPALPPALYQPGSLQGQFHPGVAQCNLVLGAQLLMKMSHVQIEILLPVESQNLFHQRHGDSLGRRLPPPSIEQPVIAELFVALPPTTHVPLANADDLGRLPPRDPFRHGPQNHFLYFHCPLHRGLRVRNHASHGLLPSPPEKRTYHVLSQPDISCANDSAFWLRCNSFFRMLVSETEGFPLAGNSSCRAGRKRGRDIRTARSGTASKAHRYYYERQRPLGTKTPPAAGCRRSRRCDVGGLRRRVCP